MTTINIHPMSLESAIRYASGWGGTRYIYRRGAGFDWDIRSHGSLDFYVLLGG